MPGAARKVRIPQELTMNIRRRPIAIECRQRGNALFVALILLLLASVITLLTLRVGVFEQRTSGNDLRAKLIGILPSQSRCTDRYFALAVVRRGR
jgi:hypothetical protein